MKNKKRLISILLTIFIIVFFQSLCICANYKNYFFKNHYGICLTPGENESMLNFAWYSKEKGDNKIKIINEEGEGKIYVGKSTDLKNGFFSNKVEVTNLKDNTTYFYSFEINGKWLNPIEYKTKNSNSFTFAFMGDVQIGASCKKMNSIEEGIKKDVLNWNKAINKALERNKNLSFIICSGDETNTKEDRESLEKISTSNLEYMGFLSPSYLQYTPIANVIGNHDKYNENFYNHFNMPNSSKLGETIAGGDYYFTYGDAIFLFLNTNNLNTKEHEKFIKNALSKNENIKWKIVCFHHDIYGDGIHTDEKNIKKLREILPHILEKNKIDLVLCGHDHIYSRTYSLKNNKKEKNLKINRLNGKEILNNPKGITYITAGSCTGSKFYESTNKKKKFTRFKYDKEETVYTIVTIFKSEIIISTYKVETDQMIDDKVIIEKDNN